MVQRTRKPVLIVIICLLIPIAFGFLSLFFGKDANWDLKNYHYYNGFSFIENRLSYDISPGQQQTYLNPIFDVLLYLLINSVTPRLVGFIYGFIHGMNISLVLLIYIQALMTSRSIERKIVGIIIILITSTGPGFLSELGNSMNDNIISLISLVVVLILIVIIKNDNVEVNKEDILRISFAGLLMGLFVGLKQTTIIFALCSGIMLLIFVKPRRKRFLLFILYGFTGILGFLGSNGLWMWRLWENFGNPLFPYFNQIFKSPMIAPINISDPRFLPKNFTEYLFWPILMSNDSFRVCEIKFLDIRFALLYLMVFAWIIFVIKEKISTQKKGKLYQKDRNFNPIAKNFIVCYVISSFFVWMILFSIYRYIIALEMLVPLCILMIFDYLFDKKKLIYIAFLIFIIIGSIDYQPFNWGRQSWDGSYIKADTQKYSLENKAVVIMLGMAPTSYVIPDFPNGFKFVRPESNLQQDYQYGLFDKIKTVINDSNDPLYILYDKNDLTVNLERSLVNLSLEATYNGCNMLENSFDDELIMCKVKKVNEIKY